MKPGDENGEADTTSICATAVTNTDLASAFVHNAELGDDFQEQMGMPDEQNMRHCWYHHYSTANCNDLVFRAAMRNFSECVLYLWVGSDMEFDSAATAG